MRNTVWLEDINARLSPVGGSYHENIGICTDEQEVTKLTQAIFTAKFEARQACNLATRFIICMSYMLKHSAQCSLAC